MSKIVTGVVHLRDAEFNLVSLFPGDTVPAWAESLITNPSLLSDAIVTEPSVAAPESTGDPEAAVAVADYSKTAKPALQKLAKERGLDESGNVGELRARLAEHDEAQAAASEGAGDGEEVDHWALPHDQALELALSRGLAVTAENSLEEIAALLDQE